MKKLLNLCTVFEFTELVDGFGFSTTSTYVPGGLWDRGGGWYRRMGSVGRIRAICRRVLETLGSGIFYMAETSPDLMASAVGGATKENGRGGPISRARFKGIAHAIYALHSRNFEFALFVEKGLVIKALLDLSNYNNHPFVLMELAYNYSVGNIVLVEHAVKVSG